MTTATSASRATTLLTIAARGVVAAEFRPLLPGRPLLPVLHARRLCSRAIVSCMDGVLPFDVDAYQSLLTTRVIGRRIDCHATTPSTMTLSDERMRLEGAAAAHGSIILAEKQTAGVGRRGRSWESPPDGNLYFSLLWTPVSAGTPAPSSPMELLPRLTQLNLAASVAIVAAAESVGVSSCRIKWPNDVWAGAPAPRKLSGTILNFDGTSGAVLGVGINVLQDLSSNETATSLRSLRAASAASSAAPAVSREAVLANFCAQLERLMALPIEAVLDEYRTHDLLLGRTIRVHHRTREETDPKDFDAEARGVDKEGQLRVLPKLGGAERVLSGEEVSISPLDLADK